MENIALRNRCISLLSRIIATVNLLLLQASGTTSKKLGSVESMP
jgi:hypothetical protein